MRARRRSSGTRASALAACLVVGALLVASCGSSSDKGSSGGTGDTSALGTPKEAKGTPVTVGLVSASQAGSAVAASFKSIEEGMNLGVEYVNKYLGGIDGHPLKLEICQGGDTPAGAQDCSNQLVNKNVAAVLQPFSGVASSIVPIITAAKIPYLSFSAASLEELTTPGAFSFTGGFPTTLAAIAAHAKAHGYKKFTLVGIDVPTVSQAVNLLGDPVFKKAGVGLELITAPAGVADMTPQVQAAANSGADAIGVLGEQNFCASFIQAFETLGLKQARYLVATCLTPENIKAYGAQMDGAYMIAQSNTDPSDPDVKLFDAMATALSGGKVEPDPTADTGHTTGVALVITFARLMKGISGEVNAAGVLGQIQAAAGVSLFMGSGTKLTCDGTAVPLFKNICSPQGLIGTVDAKGVLHNPQVLDTGPLFKS
jgi:branched-chain amino acid transport system substrate-binding protein